MNNNNRIYTREELQPMKRAQLKGICDALGITGARSLADTVTRILNAQGNLQQQQQPRGVQADAGRALNQPGDEVGGQNLQVNNVNAAAGVGQPSGHGDEGQHALEPQVGEKRSFSQAQIEELVNHYQRQEDEIRGMAQQLEILRSKNEAEERWPERKFKKPKLQHEYDALKSMGRSLYHLSHANTRLEMNEWIKKLKDQLEERGQVVVTAEEEGWAVASQLHEDVGSFLEDRKDFLKEARKKAKKSKTSKFFPSSPSPYLQRTWGKSNPSADNTQSPYPRTGKPGFSNQQAPPHITCWKCKGNHYKSNCPQLQGKDK